MRTSALLGFAVGPIATAALGFVSVPLFAWFFSSENVGRLNVLQMSCSFGMIVFSLGLDQAYIREYHVVRDRARLLKQVALPVFAFLLIATVGAFIWQKQITSLLFKIDQFDVFLGLVLAIWGTLLLRFFTTVLRMLERGWQFSFCQLFNRVLLLVLAGGGILFSEKTGFSTLVFAFAGALIGASGLAFWFARSELLVGAVSPTSINGVKPLLQFGMPLVISGFFYWGLTAAGTFALSQFSTLNQLGIYSVALSFGAAATIFQQVFTVIWAPTVYRWLTEDVDLAKIETIASNVLGAIALLLCLAGIFSWLVDWLLPDEYVNIKFYLLCTLIPPLFYTMSEVTGVGIGVTRKTWLNTVVSGLAFAINVVLCVYLVPEFGAAGAVVANTFSYTIFLVARTEAARCVWLKIPRRRLYLITMTMSLGACLTVYAGVNGMGYIFFIWFAFLLLLIKIFSEEYRLFLANALIICQRIHIGGR